MMLDTRGRCMPRHSSPVSERDAFAIFDDARCRGADLQLKRTATGLLTLGPGMCKDKLMQAAGRLRQLGRGQTLRFIGTADVTAKILETTEATVQPTTLHVLRWVMHNTVQATLHGVPEWSRQGLHFAATKGVPERAVSDEVLRLQDLYGGARSQQSMEAVVSGMAERQTQRCVNGGFANDMQAVVNRIKEVGTKYGGSHMVDAGGSADEECERELEEEEEQEQVQEAGVSIVSPASENDMDCSAALGMYSPCAIENVMELKSAVGLLQPVALHSVGWSRRVFCTANFVNATSQLPNTARSNDYLRPLENILLFQSGEILLVSEREADAFLELLWARPAADPDSGGSSAEAGARAPTLMSLCYASAAFHKGGAPSLTAGLAQSASLGSQGLSQGSHEQGVGIVDANDMVSLRLFDGQALYEEAQSRHVHGMMFGRKEVALELVRMRGKQSSLSCSDLELACDKGGQ